MTGNKTQRGSPPQHQRICALVTTVLKREEEATTMKQLMIQLSARLLRLELALSVLDKDGVVTAVLRPEQFQPEQF
jgi:coenzyme F420-reducing hydrogenase gamma subunit